MNINNEHRLLLLSNRGLIIVAIFIILSILLGGCELLDDKKTPYDSILGQSNSKLKCENAEHHPYPPYIADFQPRPTGSGEVTYYGHLNDSYAGSPELIWIIEVDSGRLGLTLTHDPADDLDLFLLGSCDPADVLRYTNRRDTASEHFWYLENDGGVYYVVADGMNGNFNGAGATLSIDLIVDTPAVEITVLDQDNMPANSVEVSRYDSAWEWQEDKDVDSSGKVVWTGLSPGTESFFNAYHHPSVAPDSMEQWGSSDDVIFPYSDTLKIIINRECPFVDSVHVLDMSLTPSDEFYIGDTVVVRLFVTNRTYRDRDAYVQCRIDRDTIYPWDFDSTSDHNTISNVDGGYFDYIYTSVDTGLYYIQPWRTVSEIDSIYQLTDMQPFLTEINFNVTQK